MGKQRVVYHDTLKPYVGEHGFPQAKSARRAHKAKAKQWPLPQRTQDGEMRVKASYCSPYRMTYKCGICDYAIELYHEMCTKMLQAHFEEKDVPFKCGVCRIYKVTQSEFHTHCKKSHWVWAALGSVCLHRTACWDIFAS